MEEEFLKRLLLPLEIQVEYYLQIISFCKQLMEG